MLLLRIRSGGIGNQGCNRAPSMVGTLLCLGAHNVVDLASVHKVMKYLQMHRALVSNAKHKKNTRAWTTTGFWLNLVRKIPLLQDQWSDRLRPLPRHWIEADALQDWLRSQSLDLVALISFLNSLTNWLFALSQKVLVLCRCYTAIVLASIIKQTGSLFALTAVHGNVLCWSNELVDVRGDYSRSHTFC